MTEWSGEPAYIRIVTDLRKKIENGEIPPGAAIPSVTALAAQHHVAATTVQKAVRALKAAGLVESAPGKGVYVRQVKREISRSADFVSPVAEGTKPPHGRSDPPEVDVVTPPDEVALKLEVEPDEQVVMRRRVMRNANGDPLEIATSYFPLDVAFDTPLAFRAKLKGATPTVLKRLGYPPRACREWVTGRMPTSFEVETLRIPSGVPVLRTLRVTWTDDGHPVEALYIVFSAERYELEYDLPVHDA